MDVRSTKRETEFFVSSETSEGEYQVINVGGQWKCTCKVFLKSKQPCKHIGRLMEYLAETEGGREEGEESTGANGMITPPAPNTSKWVQQIHGKDFIKYEGLLAMAHEQGLKDLGAAFISVDEKLALAYAWATFKGGKSFWDAGDATPNNVHAQVKAHFPRIALTRAKARVLRDALNIGMVSIEELEE